MWGGKWGADMRMSGARKLDRRDEAKATVATELAGPVQTVCVGFDQPVFDESEAAESVARKSPKATSSRVAPGKSPR